MVNQTSLEWGKAPSKIREIFAYGLDRKAQIGQDKVFDYSIGNPSVPAPAQVAKAIMECAQMPPVQVHGYTETPGLRTVRQAVAESLNRRFGKSYSAENVFMTNGASTSISLVLRALLEPGDEVIVISPFFPEYAIWTKANGGVPVVVPAREADFQIDVPAVEAAITDRTRIVIVNSPNNPVGVVYTREVLDDLARALRKASERIGAPIYLMSDEPYRELVYDGLEVPWLPDVYENTVVTYSWSKSLSLPGERIGYVLVPDCAQDWQDVFAAVCGASRALGFICASSMFQLVAAKCVDVPVETGPYERNRRLLTQILDEIGYTYIEPNGAFYLWMKALEPDEEAFAEQAKKHELLVVPSKSFGVRGWVRMGYCIDEKTIRDSAPALKATWDDYHQE